MSLGVLALIFIVRFFFLHLRKRPVGSSSLWYFDHAFSLSLTYDRIVISKCLRTLAIFSAWNYISNLVPLALYLFVLLLGSAAFFLVAQRPWRGQKRVRVS